MEVRDAMTAGKTTALIVAGSTEQNGPYVPTGKHVYVLRATAEAIARKLGNALIAPAIPFEPGSSSTTPGTIQVRETTYDALVEDEAEGLKANGFKHVILIGDSGGNQRGLERVATKLAATWAGSGTTIHYIKEYYDSWTAADGAWDSLGVPKTKDEGIHDDYSVNSIIATVDPAKIRFKQRQERARHRSTARRCCRSRRRSPTAGSWSRFAPTSRSRPSRRRSRRNRCRACCSSPAPAAASAPRPRAWPPHAATPFA